MAEPTLVLTKEDLERAVIRHWKGDQAIRSSSVTPTQSYSTGTISGAPTYATNYSTGTITVPAGWYADGQFVTGTLTGGTWPTWTMQDGAPAANFLSPSALQTGNYIDYIYSFDPGGTEVVMVLSGNFPGLTNSSYEVSLAGGNSTPEPGTLIQLSGGTWPGWALRLDPAKLKLTVNGTDEYAVTRIYDGTNDLLIPDVVTISAGSTFVLTDDGGSTSTVVDFLTERERTIVDDCIRSGYRRFLYPEPLPGETSGHAWGFLRPHAGIQFSAPYETGTVEIENGVVTLTDGTWPVWATQGEIIVGGNTYKIAERRSDTEATTNTSLNFDAGTTYQLIRTEYQLPDDFGALVGRVVYVPEVNHCPRDMVNVGVMEYRERRARGPETGIPEIFAIETEKKTESAGQRYLLRIWPAAKQEYRVRYRYDILPDAMTVATALHYGGSVHSETLLEACLWAWEEMLEGEPNGVHAEAFKRRLQYSVGHDRRAFAPENIGFNADHSDPYDSGYFDPYRRFTLHGYGNTTINVNL